MLLVLQIYTCHPNNLKFLTSSLCVYVCGFPPQLEISGSVTVNERYTAALLLSCSAYFCQICTNKVS